MATSHKLRGVDASINRCMWEFVGYAARVCPEIAVFESVRPALTRGRELMVSLRALLEERTELRYELHHVLHDAYDLGGVARRARYFWVASRVPFGVEFPKLVGARPVLADAWDDLAGLALTWETQPYRRPSTAWSAAARVGSAGVDGHVTRDGVAHRRALDVLRAAEAIGGWSPGWDLARVAKLVDEAGLLPASCDDRAIRWRERDFKLGFFSPLRWDASKPARVIMGGALSLALHPAEPRFITHREAARVMGFPDAWRIAPLREYAGLPTTWGKGITVTCGEWVARWVRSSLDGRPGAVRGEVVGDREYLVRPPRARQESRLGSDLEVSR